MQYVQGSFNRSDDGGASTNGITTGLPGGFDFYSKWHQDPVTPNTLYVGGIPTLYRSTDKGDNWSVRGTPTGTGSILDFAIAPSNNTIIYAIKFDAVSIAMADQKTINASATGAELIISTDLSCLMHIDGYIKGKNLPLKTMHIADALASGWE